MKIEPTVGRVVWFRQGKVGKGRVLDSNQPFAATVSCVLPMDKVNVSVVDHQGYQFRESNIPLVQEGDPKPEEGHYCEWMPYQIGQAKKTEEVLAKATPG